jgi:hypothetical protein
VLIRILAVLCCFVFSVWGQTNNFFIQGSDPQFGMYAKDQNFVQETANFEFFIANVNRLQPMFAVICGDLINKTGDSAQIAEYHRIAGKLNPAIKLYSVAGNHDVGNEPTPERLAAYRKNFGMDWYSFQETGIYGIVLNSSVIAFPAKVQSEAAKQEQWLREELEKAKLSGRTIVIFQHIPWFLSNPDEPDQYFNITMPIRAKYLKLFAESGVRYIFAGHYHRNAEGTGAANLAMITTGPIGMPIGPDSSGFRIVTLKGGELQQQYYGLGNIPNTYPPPPPTVH